MVPYLIAIAVVLALAGWLARHYGLLPLSRARVVVVIAGGVVQVQRGVISPAAREHLQRMAEEFAIRRARIGVAGRKVIFSGTVPQAARQPIRNVLLNM